MKMLNYHLDESDTIIEQLEQEQEKKNNCKIHVGEGIII